MHELNVETQAQLHEISQRPSSTIDFGALRATALEACRRVASIVEARETPDDAQEYKRWVLWLARQVAAAAREGAEGPISADEAAMLDEVGAALGLQQPRAASAEPPADAAPLPESADAAPPESADVAPASEPVEQ